MIKLIFLLTGAQVLRKRWYWLAFFGVALLILALSILYDISSDGLLSVPLDTLATFFVIEGIVQMVLALTKEMLIDWLTMLKGVGFLLSPSSSLIFLKITTMSQPCCSVSLFSSTVCFASRPRWFYGAYAGVNIASLA
ncbi:hypothetical protein O3W44_18370 [Pantoea sp. LMR881]|uniref:hypothetical protein n=1 Tax=Pantoea sp. LMR881 TaxID=3014336 RepID=UPI0022AFD66E|nr:hypothetical protein [Pantoea sp. LMR881]MCZ4060647.1 hypothetical protein [Pantoea sp. LMR881]